MYKFHCPLKKGSKGEMSPEENRRGRGRTVGLGALEVGRAFIKGALSSWPEGAEGRGGDRP